MTSPFPTEMEALAGNCTWHMLAEILESVTRLQERRADLGGTRKGQLKKQHLHCVSKGSDNLPGGKNDRMCLRLGPDKVFFSGFCLSLPRVSGVIISAVSKRPAWVLFVCIWVLPISYTAFAIVWLFGWCCFTLPPAWVRTIWQEADPMPKHN